MSIKERIYQLINFKHISVLSLEKSCGLSNGYLRNTKSISAENCAKILTKFPDISSDWLMLGQGEIQRTGFLQTRTVSTTGDYSPASDSGNATVVMGDAVLAERVKMLQQLIEEKNERISELKERIGELKGTLHK